MSVESIFKQLHDQTTWPAPPERPLQPYSADLRPSPMPVETLRRWTPARNCTAGRKAERPTMWLMSDIEAAVAIVALMLALAVMVAG